MSAPPARDKQKRDDSNRSFPTRFSWILCRIPSPYRLYVALALGLLIILSSVAAYILLNHYETLSFWGWACALLSILSLIFTILMSRRPERIPVASQEERIVNSEASTPESTDGIPVILHCLDRPRSKRTVHGYIRTRVASGTDITVATDEGTSLFRVFGLVVDPHSKPHIILTCRAAIRSLNFSIILPLAELLFRGLKLLCAGHWIRELALRKGRRFAAIIIDVYLFSWIIFIALLLITVNSESARSLRMACEALAVYRICELLVIYYNILLFDRIRHFERGEHYMVVSSARSVFIAMMSYGELVLCYGLLYSVAGPSYFDPPGTFTSTIDGLYFSMVTITTLGYGDMRPLGWMRLLAGSEAVLGVLFGITIVARMISWLPPVGGLHEEQR